MANYYSIAYINRMRLNPKKGPLRLMNIIKHLKNLLGVEPTRREVNDYLNLKFGRTANNQEVFAKLIDEDLISMRKDGNIVRYSVTETGERLLNKFNVTVDMVA